MSALTYLTLTKLKNQIKGLFRSPAKMIYTVIMVALLVFVIVAGDHNEGSPRPIAELGAIVAVFYVFMFTLSANSGFSTGMSIFKMPDVNFLFAGPFKSTSVLFYAMLQQMGTALIMGFFILFQYGWLRGSYGIGFLDIVYILVGYSFTVFTSQLTAMAIYSLTSGKDKLRRIVRALFIAIPVVYAIWLFTIALGNRNNLLPALINAANTLPVQLYPVGGWLAAAASGAVAGKWAVVAIGLVIWAVYVALLFMAIGRSGQDYFEDVLQSTETSFNVQSQAKEGRMSETAPKKLRMGKTGLGGGRGASVFWYKHKIENRRSRSFILSGTQLIFAVVSVAFAFFIRESGGLIAAVFFVEYMQFFSVALGRLNRELTKPYIYLVPEPPFKKLLWCLRESVEGFFVSGLLIFVPICLMLKLGPAEMAMTVIMHVSYSYVLTAVNLVTERVFGGTASKTLVFLFYFIVLAVLVAPGIIAVLAVGSSGFVMLSAEFTGCLVLTIVNALVALLAIFLCRNMLAHAELNN